MAFLFRQFSVNDDRSSMRVGTDAMLLGTLAKASFPPRNILDIGTGCGVLALMMAQKYESEVTAIEPDYPSCLEASGNFEKSPWANRISLIQGKLQDYVLSGARSYDLILSNPPFFSQQLPCPDPRRNLARHCEGLSFEDLASCIRNLLSENGLAWLILPADSMIDFVSIAQSNGLYLNQNTGIRPVESKPCNRNVFSISHHPSPATYSELTIREADGRFSEEYIRLTKDFHHHLPG